MSVVYVSADCMPSKESKVLIFIVAYHAERHIESVLERIPEAVRNSSRYHILCIDDSSGDSSAQVAADWAERYGAGNITVLRNPVNQGYGGNQKLGYRYAVDNGYDLVIMVHGDGQYAPELVPAFVELWEKTDADVILGSRMHSLASAREGGMPLYKIVGNRVLTVFQNFMTGQSLSEYHTGYRAYTTKFLRSVPFEINTNVFHFDTEILLQAFHAKAKVVELPIPTHYGDEVCRVNGLRYAKDVVIATLQYWFHSLGMFCSLRYRNIRPPDYANKSHHKYSSHAKALEIVEKFKPTRVMDLGCGSGWVAEQCTARGASVTGVDIFPPAKTAGMDRFIQADLNTDQLPVPAFADDMVLMLDVLEHLSRPEEFLLALRNREDLDFEASNPPRLVLSTPNVAFLTMRLNLLLGRFNYAERGILDITHTRLFTRASLKRVLEDCGYQIDQWIAVGPPFELVVDGSLGRLLSAFCDLLARICPTLFAFQFMVVARPKPGVAQLLRKSKKVLTAEKNKVTIG